MLQNYIEKFRQCGEIYLRVRVRPGALTTAISGVIKAEDEETVKVDIAAPAEKGKANQELIYFLAKTFSTTRGLVKIISGAGERVKLVKIVK